VVPEKRISCRDAELSRSKKTPGPGRSRLLCHFPVAPFSRARLQPELCPAPGLSASAPSHVGALPTLLADNARLAPAPSPLRRQCPLADSALLAEPAPPKRPPPTPPCSPCSWRAEPAPSTRPPPTPPAHRLCPARASALLAARRACSANEAPADDARLPTMPCMRLRPTHGALSPLCR
jgi:hypothetical protein